MFNNIVKSDSASDRNQGRILCVCWRMVFWQNEYE